MSVLHDASYDRSAAPSAYSDAREDLREWIEDRDYSGYEPYDILNSPYLSSSWLRDTLVGIVFIQFGRRWGGARMRKFLRVPASKNPKALALMLSGYCKLIQAGHSHQGRADYLKNELRRLRSPHEGTYCWGYDWDVRMLRNTRLPAFSPNAIATVFAGQALVDLALLKNDSEAREMALSAGVFVKSRLNRTVDKAEELCLSYTPTDHGRVYNSSALAGMYLARLAKYFDLPEGFSLARRIMKYLAKQQCVDGSWPYGAARTQGWIDSFHTGYNLTALLRYQEFSNDFSFETNIQKGYQFYLDHFFDRDSAPKYFHNAKYPLDIHCCAQGILTFCSFVGRDPNARTRAVELAKWTIENMKGPDGAYYYQKHRWWVNTTSYMRWGQAWMFLALCVLYQTFLHKTQPGAECKEGVSIA